MSNENKPLKFKDRLNFQENFQYEGLPISDLQGVGFEKQNFEQLDFGELKPVKKETTKYNLDTLKNVPLINVFRFFNAKLIRENVFSLNGFDFSIKEDEKKWYIFSNKEKNFNGYGYKGVIDLVKHIIAQKEDLNVDENSKSLFLAACKVLNEISLTPENDLPLLEVVNNNTNKDSERARISQIRKRDSMLNKIPLRDIAEFLGANENEDGQAGKWKFHDITSNINITNQLWKDWNKSDKGNYGGISLMEHYYSHLNGLNLDDEEEKKQAYQLAVNFLLENFKDFLEGDLTDYVEQVSYKEPFHMPVILDKRVNDIKHYLHSVRKIPQWIVEKQVETGLLFAGFPSDWENQPDLKKQEKIDDDLIWTVFLSASGQGAEMRGISRKDELAKVQAKGSDKELGGHLIKGEKDCKEKVFCMVEGAVDTYSYHAFFPGRNVSSAMGVNYVLATSTALEILDYEDYKFVVGFDNDLAGNEATLLFKKSYITQVGEEQYKEDSKYIVYFELAMECIKECIKNNKTFYFDVGNNPSGHELVSLFKETLAKNFTQEQIDNLYKNNQLKLMNIFPNIVSLKNPKHEAEQIHKLINSDSTYYFRYKDDDKWNLEQRKKYKEFIKYFETLISDNKEILIKENRIIEEKDNIAKDWNEFLVYKSKDLKFYETLQEQEKHYSQHYGKKNKPTSIFKK